MKAMSSGVTKVGSRLFARDADGRVPVTVLTGSLGAGKSTLLNHVLANKQGARICVIENEFGAVGIDEDLINDGRRKRAKGSLVALQDEVVVQLNGCICCTVRKDLLEVLKRLLIVERHPLDAVIIETTGLADPAPVAQSFFVDPDVARVAYLDAIITVVDAKHVRAQLSRERVEGSENEVLEQLAFADKVILNKIDLLVDGGSHDEVAVLAAASATHRAGSLATRGGASRLGVAEATAALASAAAALHRGDDAEVPPSSLQAEVLSLRRLIREINPTAEIIPSIGSEVPLEKLVGLQAFSLDRVQELEPDFLAEDAEHVHDKTVGSICVATEAAVSLPLLQRWIRTVTQLYGADLYRYKGILNVMGVEERVVFQGVSMLFRADFGQPWSDAEKRESKFVFIGKNLALEELAREFHECVAKPLRFAVGTPVEAMCEPGYVRGRVLRQWDEGNAYRVELQDGTNVWAPIDVDEFVRAAA